MDMALTWGGITNGAHYHGQLDGARLESACELRHGAWARRQQCLKAGVAPQGNPTGIRLPEVGEALAQGCAWQVVLPLAPAEFKRDFSEAEWSEVEALLARAEQVRVLDEIGARKGRHRRCDLLCAGPRPASHHH